MLIHSPQNGGVTTPLKFTTFHNFLKYFRKAELIYENEMKLCISSENCMVIDQIVAESRYIQKEPKFTNFASSTTLSPNSDQHQISPCNINAY